MKNLLLKEFAEQFLLNAPNYCDLEQQKQSKLEAEKFQKINAWKLQILQHENRVNHLTVNMYLFAVNYITNPSITLLVVKFHTIQPRILAILIKRT